MAPFLLPSTNPARTAKNVCKVIGTPPTTRNGANEVILAPIIISVANSPQCAKSIVRHVELAFDTVSTITPRKKYFYLMNSKIELSKLYIQIRLTQIISNKYICVNYEFYVVNEKTIDLSRSGSKYVPLIVNKNFTI